MNTILLEDISHSRSTMIRFICNIILLCDKINNIENMIDGVKQFKDEFYSKFKRGKTEQKWYYENLLKSFKEVYPSNHELILLLQRHINELFYE